MKSIPGTFDFRGENEIVCAHILWIAANGVNELIQLLLNIFFILQHDIGKVTPDISWSTA